MGSHGRGGIQSTSPESSRTPARHGHTTQGNHFACLGYGQECNDASRCGGMVAGSKQIQ